jgi:hypothetical protein
MRSAGHSLRVAMAMVFAMILSSCAHRDRSPDADHSIEVRAVNGSAFVFRSRDATTTPYELRQSVKLTITSYGELTDNGRGFSPAILFPVERTIHCQLGANGELFLSKGEGDRTEIGRLPVFRVAEVDGRMSPLFLEHGFLHPVAFVLVQQPGGSLTMRAAVQESR